MPHRKDIYQFFCTPVNEAEVPGYRDVIKNPMDFGTMEGKLGGGAYRTPEEFKVSEQRVNVCASI